jgi:hypothetical protein
LVRQLVSRQSDRFRLRRELSRGNWARYSMLTQVLCYHRDLFRSSLPFDEIDVPSTILRINCPYKWYSPVTPPVRLKTSNSCKFGRHLLQRRKNAIPVIISECHSPDKLCGLPQHYTNSINRSGVQHKGLQSQSH